MEKGYLIIDIGTGNARVGLVSSEGAVICVRTKDTDFQRDLAYTDGLYFDPVSLLDDICSLICEIVRACPDNMRICAVSSTSARESIILLDRGMNAFYALPNVDNRGLEFQNEIGNNQEVYKKTGRWLSTIFPALKLYGLRKRREAIFNRIHKITSISDWIGYEFTGELAYEFSQACETQLMDIEKRSWSPWLCAQFNLSKDILPETVCSGTILGKISCSISDRTGLPADIPFIVGGADTQVAVIGCGAQRNALAIVSGTTSPTVRILDHFLYDAEQRCWMDCHVKEGEYLLESNAGVTGLNYQRFKAMFFSDVSYEELDLQMQAKTSQRVYASLGTLIFKENRSLRNGGFHLPSPLAPDIDRFDFALAIANDIAFSIASNYENQLSIYDQSFESLIGCGGGLQSRKICQTIADVTGKHLILPQGYTQASLIGCAKICSEAMGFEMFKQPIVAQFEPNQQQDGILEQYAEWDAHRQLLNPS